MEPGQPLPHLRGQLDVGGAAVGAPADHPLVDADQGVVDLDEDLPVVVEHRDRHPQPG